MTLTQLKDQLERTPVIAAVTEHGWTEAVSSPAEVLFYLRANLLTVGKNIAAAHTAGKTVFVHMDLADGIGRDKTGIAYLASCGVDGIISTHGQLLRQGREQGLLTVQRFFVLDTQGLYSITEQLQTSTPDLIEVMPGVISKAIERFANSPVPVIAGGLIETKSEVTAALGAGATAISTGTRALWYL